MPGVVDFGPKRFDYAKSPANPVLEKGEEYWEARGVLHVFVLRHPETGEYMMWYSAMAAPGYEYREIGLATSPDGVTWTKYEGNPVLRRGAAGEFDDVHLHMPTVLWDAKARRLRMWYVGYQNGVGHTIGYAESPDGKQWTKFGKVLGAGKEGEFDSASLRVPTVIFDADEQVYKMWYNGTQPGEHYGPTGYATSPDGIHWTKHGAITEGPRLLDGHVEKIGGRYHMWWNSGPDIAYSWSEDGITWTDEGVILRPGPKDYDAQYIQAPTVVVEPDGGLVHLWYNGATKYPEEVCSVGYAEGKRK
jgi:predicted GH43/DUF377 family glycosyl hydrolase